jgi:hypothetical protein
MAFDVDAARKAGYSDAEIAQHLAGAQRFDLAGAKKAGYSDAEVIASLAPRAAGAPAPAPSIVDRAIGAGEAALSTITGATGGLLGSIGGALGGAAGALVSGDAYLPPGSDPARVAEAQARMSEAVSGGAQALTYAPRTDQGQQQSQAVGEALQQLVPAAPVMQALAVPGAVRSAAPARVNARAAIEGTARDVAGIAGPAAGDAAAALASGAIDAGASAARATGTAARAVQRSATTLPRRAWESITGGADQAAPTPGTRGSVGAAATDAATQRIATAENLGLTGDSGLTLGQATRDPAQLKFEVETSKNPEMGGDLRQRRVNQNDVLLRNFDNWVDQTGAEAPTLRAVGQAVDSALVKQFDADKAGVRAAYNRAHRSPEAQAIVDQDVPVSIGEGDRALTGTPLSWINSQPTGVPAVQLVDAARQYAVKLGVAEMRDGELVPRPATIRQLEEWRTAIGEATGYDAPEIRQATILKGLIDAQTEPVAGPLYRQARATRRRLAENYEDRAVIAKLLNDKRGTADRQVALEDVFSHSILKGSLDDVRNVQRVLMRSGDEGKQAWRELQGATVRWIRDEATKGVAADGAGNRVLSPAALDKAIRALDHDEKLQRIFGKAGAQRLRDINDIAQVAKTVPPEAAINFSNTASTLLTGFADLGLSSVSGIPAPLATATRLGLKHVKDRKLRQRINESLRPQGRSAQPERSAAQTF